MGMQTLKDQIYNGNNNTNYNTGMIQNKKPGSVLLTGFWTYSGLRVSAFFAIE
jgi:hypothetical protein